MRRPLLSQLLCFLALVCHASSRALNYPLVYGDASALRGASQKCIDTFNSNVTCTPAIGSLYADPYPEFSINVLDELCTATCFESLVSLRNSVLSQCGSSVTYLDIWDGTEWPITYLADVAIFNYNATCLMRSDGQYCNTWFQTEDDATSDPLCDECYIKTVYMQAESPIEGDTEEEKSMYASMTSSCGYSGPAATKTASKVVISSPTASPDCVSHYTVKSGDTAIGVSLSQKVSTQDLITANGLDYNLENFPSTGSLCIRNQCKVYTLRSADTCQSIYKSLGVYQARLLSWNPFINGHCDNIANFVSQTICLSNPLGDYSVGNNTDPGYYTELAAVPEDIAPETTTNCGVYHKTTVGEDCGVLTMKYTISLEDFIFLNPMVWDNCTNLWANTSYCAVPVGLIEDYPGYVSDDPEPSYSINPEETTEVPFVKPFQEDENALYIPIANDSRTDCWDYIWWNSSRTSPASCWDVAFWGDISNEEFILWNPSLDQNSNNTDVENTYDYDCIIAPSVSYCLAVASPTPAAPKATIPASPRGAGEIDGCTSWFKSILSCETHVDFLRISLADLFSFNPSIGADCSTYVLGTYYCYSISEDGAPPEYDDDDESAITTSPSPTTSPSAGATPTPTQAGMATGCTSFYYVASGDGCWNIADKHGISLDTLYAWNPALNGDCSGLWPDYYLCVSQDPVTTTSSLPRTSTTSSVSTPTAPPLSEGGECGGTGGQTCLGSTFGNCCSLSGWCKTCLGSQAPLVGV